MPFHTQDGTAVPAATAEQMREVDRIAVGVHGRLGLSFEPFFGQQYWIRLVVK